jgi:uroporphyrinogen decarboxylase
MPALNKRERVAIVRLAREGVLTPAEHASFGRPYDLRVLSGVEGAPFNLLHVCGPRAYFEQVSDYPVHAINWAAVGQGNPTLAEARKLTDQALVGWVDEAGAIQHGLPGDVIAEARATIEAAGVRGLLLSPGCGVALNVPAANLWALRQAA